MINRYKTRKKLINDSSTYSNIFESRGVKKIEQYSTPRFFYFTEEQLSKIKYFEHIWTPGDRLYKLAYIYFGEYNDWWIILRFNKLKSEMDIKAGDIIKIPLNIEDMTILVTS